MWPFYVYELIDPRTDAVFYVGKGLADRVYQHEWEARSGVHSAKCARIREILKARKKVVRRFVAYFRDEQDAYDFETDLISEHGLENLTNVLPGGQKAWAEREAVKKRRARKRIVSSKPFAKCVANYLKIERGIMLPPDDSRPLGQAIWEASKDVLPKFWREMQELLTFEELREALAPFGIRVLRSGEDQAHGQVR